MKFVYLVGVPGAGKSTVAAALRRLSPAYMTHEEPVPHMVMERGGLPWYAELGRVRKDFSGTDALSMDIITKAIPWVGSHPYRRMFAEGDRLANDRFFEAVKAAGYDLTVAFLDVDRDVLEERRARRAAQVGKAQNETWLKGRESKVRHLYEKWATVLLKDEPVQELRALLG
jgi:hypothetical protein